jgi:hypothetical protein
MQMGKGIMILKKAVGFASYRMLMDISGRDLIRIYKFIMFNQIE